MHLLCILIGSLDTLSGVFLIAPSCYRKLWFSFHDTQLKTALCVIIGMIRGIFLVNTLTSIFRRLKIPTAMGKINVGSATVRFENQRAPSVVISGQGSIFSPPAMIKTNTFLCQTLKFEVFIYIFFRLSNSTLES